MIKKSRLNRILAKNKTSKIIFACLIFAIFMISPMTPNRISQNVNKLEENQNQNNLSTTESPQNAGTTNGTELNGGIEMNNASQFNVREQALYLSKLNELNIENQELTYYVPNQWTGTELQMNIPSVFQKSEYFKDYSMNGNFDSSMKPWVGSSNYLWSSGTLPTNPYVKFTYNQTQQYAYAEYNSGSTTIPSNMNGYFNNTVSNLNKAGQQVETGQLYQKGQQQIPTSCNFTTDPGYNVLIDPYGTGKQNSQVYAQWISSLEADETKIQAANSYFGRGDPSVAFQTPFYIPFEADSVTITIGWAVQNLGYTQKDGFQAKAQIDNQYINGENGINGISYANRTDNATCLENDDKQSETASHSQWIGTYNITSLTGAYGYRAGWHSLNFGCYLATPQLGSEVAVDWSYIMINATHYNWYRAATLNFNYLLTDLSGNNGIVSSNTSLVAYVGDPNTQGSFFRYYINNTANLPNSANWNDRQNCTIVFPQTYAKAFEVDNFMFAIGLEQNGTDPSMGNTAGTLFDIRLSIDTFSLKVNYILGTPESLGLQVRPVGTTTWINLTNSTDAPISSYNITNESLALQFQLNSSVTNAFLRISSYLVISKYSLNAAEASVSVNSWNNTQALWSITYNNTDSINEINNTNSLTNTSMYLYSLRIENMPAFDGLGNSSKDWNLDKVTGPGGIDFTQYAQRTSDNPYLQNGTIVNATRGNPQDFLCGVWTVYASQQNYLLNATIQHSTGPNVDKYYSNDGTIYNASVRPYNGTYGNYNITMFNASGSFVQGFPSYNLTTTPENLTASWNVIDQGVGIYTMTALWNDTNSNNQTERIGWRYANFEVWRKTSATLITQIGDNVAAGNLATYQVQFNQTLDNLGILNASILAYRNATNNLWGKDWPPNVYLLDSLQYTGSGIYNITLKTLGVPQANYSVYFKVSKPYYDIQITTSLWLNITGILSNMSITYQYGVANDSKIQQLYLTSGNIPYINDTVNSWIQFKLNNETDNNGALIRDAYVTAVINSSNDVMTAYEQYPYTQLAQDKGVYNLTLNTMGLHATGKNFDNYSLELSFTAPGYRPIFENISIQVNPAPIVIQTSPIENLYEGNSIEIDAGLYLNITGTLDPCDSGILNWELYNGTGILRNGLFNQQLNNYFTGQITSNSSNYLYPGNYSVIIKGSGNDLENSSTNPMNFTIYAKYVSNMTLIFPDQIRIGGYFSIAAKLTYITNGSAIANQDLILTVNYSADYSFQVLLSTDSSGKAIYEMSIPQYYEGNNLTVFGQYQGSGLILSTTAFKEQIILGKIPVNITFVNPPDHVQVGYNATFNMNLTILGEQNYAGKIVFFFAFYDNASQPFLTKEVSLNSNGTASQDISQIDDGYKSLTVYFEFVGDSQTATAISNITIPIYPKWISAFNYTSLPQNIRLGQALSLNYTLYSPNSTFTESMQGMPIKFVFNYNAFSQTYNLYTDENGSVSLSYNVPDSGVSNLSLAVTFQGTSKIYSCNYSVVRTILPKMNTVLTIQSSTTGQLLAGSYYFTANLTDNSNQPLIGVNITFDIYDNQGKLVNTVSGVTNQYGFTSVSIDLKEPGTYTIKASFAGENIYAPIQSKEINVQVVTYFTLFVNRLPEIAIIVGIIVAAIITYQRGVVIPRRNRRLEALKAIHQRFADVENIQYILILTKDGISIFSRSFTSIPIDETLISGFLSAISSFGAELGQKMKGAKADSSGKGLEQLSYKQFKIIVNDAALVRTAVLLMKDASESLREKVKRFNYRFQERFLEKLQKFKGQLLPEGPILELIEQIMEVDMLYPHNVNLGKFEVYKKTFDKKSIERLVLDEAVKPPFNNIFYIRDMINTLTEKDKKEIMIFNAIDTLRKDGAIFAINPRTQSLIDKFKPIIDKLPDDAKILLNSVWEGTHSETKLRKIKGIKDFDSSIKILLDIGALDEKYNLTDTGEAISTLLKLMRQV